MIRVVVGLIKRADTLLVAQRPPDKPYSGYWEFPGGKIEAAETGLEALKRELQEELGIDVLQAEHCFDHQHRYPDKSVFLEIWKVTELNGEPHGKENQNLHWATKEDLHKLRLLEGNLAIMDEIIRLY